MTGVVRGYGGFGATGQPMPHQAFEVEDAAGRRTTVEADDDGRFSVSLAPGTYTLLCRSRGEQFTVAPRQSVEVTCDIDMA